MAQTTPWRSYSTQLSTDCDELERRFVDLVSRSTIVNIDINNPYGSVAVIGFPSWGWGPDPDLIAERTRLLADYSAMIDRVRLLHREAVMETRDRLAETDTFLRGWLERKAGDWSVPASVAKAMDELAERFKTLGGLIAVGVHGPAGLVAVPDTNVLIRSPDVAAYKDLLGTDDYMVVLVPAVMAELDDLKDRGRTSDVRDAAERAVKRIKGFRDRGNLQTGVKVQGRTMLRAEHREPDTRSVLQWLDPAVPDDRIIATALDLQARQPAAAVVLVTRDLNLQNKAAAVGLPFVE